MFFSIKRPPSFKMGKGFEWAKKAQKKNAQYHYLMHSIINYQGSKSKHNKTYFTPTRMARTRNKDITSVNGHMEELESSYTAGGDVK